MRKYRSTRAPRPDLRREPPAPDQQLCGVCNRSPCDQSCRSWNHLHAAVLCIGIDKYTNLVNLPNAMRDARELRNQANAVLGCRAELLQNPNDYKAVMRGIDRFLNRDGLKQHSPTVVAIVLSGHGMQAGGIFYFLPAGSDPNDPYCRPFAEFISLP